MKFDKFFNSMNVHHLFGVAMIKSNFFKRRISYFRTTKGVVLILSVRVKEGNPFITIAMKRGNLGSGIEEEYNLSPDGGCDISVSAEIISATGGAIHFLQKREDYKPEQILAKWPYEKYPELWILRQLNTLADYLKDERTVRIDPYNPDRVLGDDDDRVDYLIATNLAMVENFARKLHDTPLTPGIHTIG